MSNIVIRVNNLSKQYKLGARRDRHDTLRDHLAHGFKSLFSRNGRSSSLASQPSTLSGPQSAVSGHPSSADGRSDTFWALKDVSFEIKQGEVVGIIGRNGAGKSTLLKILSRITEPTSGFAEIRGRVGSLLEVGTGFHGELTGRENIYLNGAIMGMKKAEIERKFDEIVAFAEVEKFIDTPVKRYSSGMYVRLAFSVAAHLELEILIVDEVLAVGDASFQKKCLGKMGNVAKEGRTILFVSHNMGSLTRLCPRCLWLDNGQVKESGDTSTIIASYLAASDNGAKSPSSTFPLDTSKESQLRSARVLNLEGLETGRFRCDEPVTIEVTYQVHREVPGLYAYLALLGEGGVEVLVSDSHDTAPNPFETLPVGIHTILVTIPPRILAHGTYQVYFDTASRFGQNFTVDCPGVVGTFHLDDYTSLRGNRRSGFFSTLLDWKVKVVERKSEAAFDEPQS